MKQATLGRRHDQESVEPMAGVGPNFAKILLDTITAAGVEGDQKARAEIYARARRTVVDRARAGGTEDIDGLQKEMDSAIGEIEVRFSELALGMTGVASGTPASPTAVDPGPAASLSVATAGDTRLRTQGGGALAMALPEPEPTEDLAIAEPEPATEPEPQKTTPVSRNRVHGESPAADRENAPPEQQNVFPIWKRLKTARSKTRQGVSSEPLSDSEEPRAGNRNPFTEKVTSLDSGTGDGTRGPAYNAAGDPLDRVAADIAAGFREIDMTMAGSVAGVTLKEPTENVDEIGLSEPDEALVRDVGKLVPGIKDRAAETAATNIEDEPIEPSDKRRLPELAFSLPAIDPGAAVAGLIALFVLGSGAYFSLNPRPANPAFASAASENRLIPDAVSLDGEGWVARNVQIEAAGGLDWSAFQVSDTSGDRFGSLVAPLNDALAPKGFKVSLRLGKSANAEAGFAAIRVTAPFTRRGYTMDAMIDLHSGEVQAGGNATMETISIVDEGDSWRLFMSTPLEGNILFSKPRLEIFPAAGKTFGAYLPAATGAVTIGEINVEKL